MKLNSRDWGSGDRAAQEPRPAKAVSVDPARRVDRLADDFEGFMSALEGWI